ncbi:DoxX family protein [Amycolatopsis anabasis]|uniref:DoxX family protein n=1 Tax=Amycolatopsis anabasis TaxID=1840409 RepID=UPI00131B992E|nr:DoxX family protein [Amycolatopsis anabasis]
MSILIGLLSVLLTFAFVGAGGAKLAGVENMTRSLGHLGVSPGLTRAIGGLELAAAAGLIAGFWITPIGFAASMGLMLLMVGAVARHLRARDPVVRAAPAAVLGVLSVANAVLLALA